MGKQQNNNKNFYLCDFIICHYFFIPSIQKETIFKYSAPLYKYYSYLFHFLFTWFRLPHHIIFQSIDSHIIALTRKSHFFLINPRKSFYLRRYLQFHHTLLYRVLLGSFIFRNFLESHMPFLFPIMLLIQYLWTKHSMHQTHLLWQAKPSDKRSVKRHNLQDYRLLRLYYVLLISPTPAEMINDALSCWINEALMYYSAAFGNFRKFGFVIIGGILGV